MRMRLAAAIALGMMLAMPATTKGPTMTEAEASGPFDVTLTPGTGPEPTIAAMAIAKTFHGDLEGTSIGQMLSAGDPKAGSAGYVAMERVTGTLAGRAGSFALQHSGTMDAGGQALTVLVVPGSGTGALAGLAGTMAIEMAGGKHRYRLHYALPE